MKEARLKRGSCGSKSCNYIQVAAQPLKEEANTDSHGVDIERGQRKAEESNGKQMET